MSKIQEIRAVRSIDLSSLGFFKPSKNKTRRGLHPFHSKLDDITGQSKDPDARNFEYNPQTKRTEVIQPVRITRVKSRGKNRFHAVGLGEIAGTFSDVKSKLKEANFTGYVWMGRKCQLA